MRAATDSRVVAADPGSKASVVVDVVNTGEVIDGISANVIGLPDECVSAAPPMLPLFPSAAGQLTLSLSVPASYPAGRHPLTVELVSHGAHVPSQFLDVDLDVAARPSMTMAPVPRLIRARRSARFVLEIKNDGNLPVTVDLQAVDVDRSIRAEFTPPQLRVEPGALVPVLLHVRGPRMFTGSEAERAVKIVATARRGDLPADADPALAGPPIPPRESTVRLRQRPLLSRGMLTALVLLSIVALWAGVFLLGLTKVFSNDPMTKAAPASFFVASGAGGAAGSGGGGAQGATIGGPGAGGAPAGALPKSGQLPAGIGGQITGTVLSASTEQPVGQILVEAFRAADPQGKAVSSAATQADGTYTLGGLFPTSYLLKFSAPGFKPVWYPNSPAQNGARQVGAQAQGTTSGINAVIRGLPATISGSVDPGDTLRSVPTTVTARPLDVAGGNAMSRTVTTTGGKYTIAGLAAPASYQLTFTTPGYQTSTVLDSVNGGDHRIEASVTLGAAQGSISGIVVSGSSAAALPIGGATVTTTVGGRTLSVLTPTTGAVGTFTIPNLPTPATYVVNYSAPGHGSWTQVIDLSAGENSNKGLGKLSNGSGSISGVVHDGNSPAGLGGVTVTVGGAPVPGSTDGTSTVASAPSTTSLTNGNVGAFLVNGLADGQYTLTFSLDGYTTASLPVTLDSNRPANQTAPVIQVHLFKESGEILGTVFGRSSPSVAFVPLTGATVTATDGTHTYTATSSVSGGALQYGQYDLAALPPGTYSVTAAATGYRSSTRIVTVGRGQSIGGIDLHLGGA